MKKIVIAGAGFAGLNTALRLEKKFRKQKDIEITLIDKRDYHLFNPSLYEIATAEEEMTSISQLKKSVALPIQELLAGKRVNFIRGEVGSIDRQKKKLMAGGRTVQYDYLILAFGSQTEYFGVEGAQEFALPLKNLNDAFRIRNQLGFAVQAHLHDSAKQYVRFVVAGGGYTGVEVAAEMANLANILAWKNNYPREKIEILIIEAQNQLVPGFDHRAGRDIYQRLAGLGVRIKLLSSIFKVQKHSVILLSGERLLYDALIWTTGVRAQTCYVSGQCDCNKKGQYETDQYFRIMGETHVFAIGDIACIHDSGKAVIPSTAQAAVAEAKYLSKILPRLLQNKIPAEGFVLNSHPFIVSVGGKWEVFKSDKFYFTGYPAYLLHLGANARYYAGLLGWWKAIKYVLGQAELYGRND